MGNMVVTARTYYLLIDHEKNCKNLENDDLGLLRALLIQYAIFDGEMT